jgi:hypothetical protein
VESDQSNPADSASNTPEPSEAFQPGDKVEVYTCPHSDPVSRWIPANYRAELTDYTAVAACGRPHLVTLADGTDRKLPADRIRHANPPSDFPGGSHKPASESLSVSTVDPSSDTSIVQPGAFQVPCSPIHEALRAWQRADDAWSAELTRQFGQDACNQRYLPHGKGEPGSTLRQLHDAWNYARMQWEALVYPSATSTPVEASATSPDPESPATSAPCYVGATSAPDPDPVFPPVPGFLAIPTPPARVSPKLTVPCSACDGHGYIVVALAHPDDASQDESEDCERCEGTGRISAEPHAEIIRAVNDAADGKLSPEHAWWKISFDAWDQAKLFFQAIDFDQLRTESLSQQIARFIRSCLTGWPIDGSSPHDGTIPPIPPEERERLELVASSTL